jgi:hypothetical protein
MKYQKINESLPRQSTVDQLKRIREEINKSQIIKVGPEEIKMGGDIGDRVIDDLKKHKGKQEMNNLFWWDNPLDRHIDSYETFVRDDSRSSLGYTKDGDPKFHRGTDYVKENDNNKTTYNKNKKIIKKFEMFINEETFGNYISVSDKYPRFKKAVGNYITVQEIIFEWNECFADTYELTHFKDGMFYGEDGKANSVDNILMQLEDFYKGEEY